MPIVIRAALKPISTTVTPLRSVDLATGKPALAEYQRSDFSHVPRACVVAEAMVAWVLADALMEKLGGDSIEEMKVRWNAQTKDVGHSSLAVRHPSLVLTGFMGTGKTSVGKIVARKLGRKFVDMDEVIEARERKSVREIFEARGETDFRARESELCAELGARENLVIATGGGALVDANNLSRFAQALVICLDAEIDQILSRLGNSMDRPLLRENPRERVIELLSARREAYGRIERHIETTGKGIEQVANEILELCQKAIA